MTSDGLPQMGPSCSKAGLRRPSHSRIGPIRGNRHLGLGGCPRATGQTFQEARVRPRDLVECDGLRTLASETLAVEGKTSIVLARWSETKGSPLSNANDRTLVAASERLASGIGQVKPLEIVCPH
jgi:hypothetical protein